MTGEGEGVKKKTENGAPLPPTPTPLPPHRLPVLGIKPFKPVAHAQDAGRADAVVGQLVDEPLHDIVEPRAQPAARHDGGRGGRWVVINGLARPGAQGPGRKGHAHLVEARGEEVGVAPGFAAQAGRAGGFTGGEFHRRERDAVAVVDKA